MIQRRARVALCCAAAIVAAPLAAAAPATASNVAPPARFQFDSAPGRLSKQVVPSHYALTLELDPAREDFAGRVAITLQLRAALPAIELHAQELSAGEARLVAGDSARALVVTPLPGTQMWRLAPQDGAPIAPGRYRLEIAYRGPVHGYDDGLFRAPYRVNGQPRQMLATQLEASFARMLFPGFDEPAFRASFEISVRAPAAYEVVSNMPRTQRVVDGEQVLHRFAPTPPMPSYLVSVAVGRFDAMAGQAGNVPLRVLAAEGKREQGRFALRAAQQLLPYYAAYFGVPYALPKLDQLAVPSVRSGAMEDWGLISYSEDTLLVDAARSSPHTVRNVYETVAHEVAHQWFGNLVTAASWEEIWLNEAFATWMESKASDHFHPDWKMALQQRLPIDRAMAIDAGSGTRPIRSGPVSETSVSDVFDAITYAKGGAVLAMLEQWIGPAAFQRGLAAYMKGQRLSNATAGDLWHYIGDASGRDVAAVAASWTDQPGYPLVSVSERCVGGRSELTLAQTRFLLSDATGAPDGAPTWRIPVRLARGTAVSTVLLDTPSKSVTLGACAPQPWLANAGGAGFYRVAYANDALQALTRRFASLDGADRATLMSDSFALVQAGRLPLAAYLALLAALPQATDDASPLLWSLANQQLDFLDHALAGTPAQAQLRALGRVLYAPQLARLGWAPRAHEAARASSLRPVLIAQLAKFDDADTIAQALRRFDDDEAGRAPLPAAIRSAVIEAVGMHADRAHFDRLVARLKGATNEEERWLYASALGGGRDAARVDELLGLSLANIAPANISAALPGLVARSSPFGEQAYRYTLAHWKPLAALAGSWNKMHLLPNAAVGFSSAERATALLDDQRHEAGADGDVTAAREAEAIRLRAAVRQRESTALEQLMQRWHQGG